MPGPTACARPPVPVDAVSLLSQSGEGPQRDAFDAPDVGVPKIWDNVRFGLPSSAPHLPPARASRYAPCRTSLACGLYRRVARDKLPKRSPGTEGTAVWEGDYGVCCPRAVFFSAHCFLPPL